MCQAIVKQAGLTISKNKLKCAWDSNPHGAGFAYRTEKNEIVIEKGFFTFKDFWKAYRPVQKLDVLIHFRFATHGEKIADNCHPFQLGKDSAIIHNGVLDRFLPRANDKRSDTRVFVEDLLNPALQVTPLPVSEFMSDEVTQALLESLIGGSKLAALTPDGFVIVNEDLGTWDSKGIWWSAGIPRRWDNVGLDFDFEDCRYWKGLENAFAHEEEDCCSMCFQPSGRLYQVGAENVCRYCWDETV